MFEYVFRAYEGEGSGLPTASFASQVEAQLVMLQRFAAFHRQRGALAMAARYLRQAAALAPQLRATAPALAGTSPVWRGVAGQALLLGVTSALRSTVLAPTEEPASRVRAHLQRGAEPNRSAWRVGVITLPTVCIAGQAVFSGRAPLRSAALPST